MDWKLSRANENISWFHKETSSPNFFFLTSLPASLLCSLIVLLKSLLISFADVNNLPLIQPYFILSWQPSNIQPLPFLDLLSVPRWQKHPLIWPLAQLFVNEKVTPAAVIAYMNEVSRHAKIRHRDWHSKLKRSFEPYIRKWSTKKHLCKSLFFNKVGGLSL